MITNLKVGHNKGLTLHLFDIIDEELTSSFVVWFEPTKYEWKPVNPTIDQIEKKQIIASKIVQKVKDTISNHEKCNCASTVWHDLIICSVIFIIFCSYCLLQHFFPEPTKFSFLKICFDSLYSSMWVEESFEFSWIKEFTCLRN